jgi:hypothetical protein
MSFMATTTVQGTTAHIKVDERYAGLLAEDFGLSKATITRALIDEPQRAAIAICEWASRTDQPTRALLAWARKHRAGSYRPVGV